MPEKINSLLDNTSGLPLDSRASTHILLHNQSSRFQREFQRIFPVLLAVLVGGGVGLAVIVSQVSTKWTVVVFLAAVAVPVVLLVNDVKRLVLIAFVVDAPLGIDIAIQNQGWHQGGPTGYMVSLMTIALIVGYALWIMEREPKPRLFPLVTIPALLYLFMTAFSFFQSRNWQLSAFGLFFKLQLFLMYFYVVNHVRTWADIRLIVITAAICLLLESTLMVFQYFTGGTLDIGGLVSSEAMSAESAGEGVTGARISGTLARPGNAALYLNSMLTLVLGAYLGGKLIDKRLALGALSLGIVALVTTSSRGGWVAFAVALLVMLGLIVWTEAGKKLLLIFLFGGSLMGIFFGGQIQERLVTTQEDKSREELATMAYNIIRAYPWGIGENTYDLYMRDEYAHPAWVGHTKYPVHNHYLLTWSQLGPQGLAAFVLLLIAPIWQTRRWLFRSSTASHYVILAAGLLGGLAAHMLHMTSETFSGGPPVELLWFILAMIVAVNWLIPPEPAIVSLHSDQSHRHSHLVGRKSKEST
jgi:hypothetical protein